jgi:hypothetical protein
MKTFYEIIFIKEELFMKVSVIDKKKPEIQVRVQGQVKKEQKGIYNIKL